MLGKLRLADAPTQSKVQSLALIVRYIISASTMQPMLHSFLAFTLFPQRHPIADTTSRNAITRFDNSLKKKYGELLGDMDEEELRISEDMRDLWSFIDDR